MAETPRELRRGIGGVTLTALIVNCMVGAGVLGLPGKAVALAGGAIYVVLTGAALVALGVALCLARLGAAQERTGGPILYVGDAIGPFAGFATGVLPWLGTVMSAASLLNLLAATLTALLPQVSRFVGIAAIVVALSAITLSGVRQSAWVNNLLTIAKIGLLVVVGAAGLAFLVPVTQAAASVPSAGAAPMASIPAAIVLLFFAFVGFERPTAMGGEIVNPRHTLPAALIAGVALVTLLYLIVLIACQRGVPDLAATSRPLTVLAGRLWSAGGARVFDAAAIVVIGGTLFTMWLTAPRLLFCMGESAHLPAALARLDVRGTPWLAILVTAGTIAVLALAGSFAGLLVASSTARLVIFAGCALALRRPGERPPPRGPCRSSRWRRSSPCWQRALLASCWRSRRCCWSPGCGGGWPCCRTVPGPLPSSVWLSSFGCDDCGQPFRRDYPTCQNGKVTSPSRHWVIQPS